MDKLITKYFYFILLSGSSLLYSQNYSLSFDGQDDYVSIADDQSLTSTSMMTISAWFKKVSGPGWMSLVGKGTSDANEEYILMLKDDQVYFDVGQGGGPYLQQSTTIDSETWYHIAAVHTRSNGISTLKVYLNGEDVGGTTIGATSTPNDNSHTLTIGSRFSTPNALFKGQIDDVRIWNDALVGQQIQEIMYNNLSGYEDELIGYWNFNDGEGSTLTDLSGNGNNGSIDGASWSNDIPPTPPISGGNNALSFDGRDDYLQSSNNISLSGNSHKTLLVRFKFDETPIGVQYVAGWGWNGEGGQPGNQNFSIASVPFNHPDLYSENNNLMMWGVGTANVTDIQFNYFLNPGEWCDAAITHDGSELKLYINGEMTNSADFNSEVFESPLILAKQIGNYDDRQWFDGNIDHVLVYDRILETSEIQHIYNTNSHSDNGLVLGYSLNETDGQLASDFSNSENDGNVLGATWSGDSFTPPVYGCTDSYANNFNYEATADDGSCSGYVINGDYSLDFYGAGNVKVPTSNNLPFSNSSRTMTATFKVNNLNEQGIIAYGEPGELLSFGITIHQGKFCASGWSSDLLTDISPEINRWYNVVYTYNENGTRKLYIDGNLLAQDNTNLNTGWNDYIIIGDWTSETMPLNGKIFDISIWDSVLSNDEINYYLTNPFPVDDVNLVGYWKLSSGQGDIIFDHSGSQNHGDIFNVNWSLDTPIPSVIFVPGDFALIQEAIDSASDNDTIFVATGVYNENLNFNGKSIILVGEDPQNTIIDGGSGNTLPTVKLWGYNYSSSTQISSFKIQNYGNDGISILDGGSPRISNCIIYGVHGTDNAGGIYIGGDGIGSSVIIERCLIYGNSTTTDEGGGVRIASNNGNSSAQIINSTITQNSPEGIKIHGGGTQVDIVNSIIYDNSENSITNQGNLNISYSNLEGNFAGGGLINLDPMFVNPSNGDFYLQAGSPSIDSGDTNSSNDPDGTIADMGAFYYNQDLSQNTNVTLMVNMRDYQEIELENGDIYSGDLSEGLFVSGGNIGFMADSLDQQIGYQMLDDDGDLIYKVTIELEKDSLYWYKFRIGPTDGNWQGNWESISDCGYGDYSDRYFSTTYESNQTVGPYCFNSCENCEIPNKSLSFDGVDDYVEIPDSEILDGMSQMTIQFYMKWNAYPYQSYGKGVQVLEKWETANSNATGSYSFYTHHDADMLTYMVRTENNQLGVNIDLSANMSLGVWYQVTGVYDGQYSSLYLNGILQGEVEMSGNVASTPYSLELANQGNVNSTFFDGSIDEVIIWDIALSQEQIQSNMYVDLSGNETGLVGYWNFNDGEGSVLTDLSGNGNDGTISGATWSDDVPQPLYSGPEWYVSESGSDNNNGSQDYPFSSIQYAINSSNDGDSIFVGPSTYFENINFNGKAVRVISIDGPSVTTINGNQSGSVVTFNSGESFSTFISGFSIINGNSDFGGGIACFESSPTIENCIIRNNSAGGGGGVSFKNNSNPVLISSLIENNEATLNDLGGGGGGINCDMNSSPTVTDVIIKANTAEWGGGGINISDNSNPIISSVSIIENTASDVDGYGGGIAVEQNSNPELINVVIAKNTAYYGGACNFYVNANAVLSNVTIADNSAQSYGGISSYNSNLNLINCILWGNSGQSIFASPELDNVTYSNIEGGYSGEGNFDESPNFCNPAVGVYELSNSSSSLFSGQDSSYVGFSQDPGCNEPYSNYSLSFDGEDDYVELQQITNIGSVSNTVSMWVKIPVVGQDNLNEGERVGNLLGNYDSSPNSNWEVTQGKIRIYWNNGEKDINGNLDLRDNQWHHLAFVRDKENNQYLAYIDGELDVVSDGSGSDISFNTPFLIGKDYRSGSGIPFHGVIDEVSIWDIALTQGEIQNQSSRALSGFESGLIAHYNFNEANGDTLFNVTGNGNDGIINGPTSTDGVPLQAPIAPDPEIYTLNVDINGNDVFMSVDAIGDYSYIKWRLDWTDSLSSYSESINFENLSPGLHYVRVSLYSNSNGQITDELLQSFYILDGLTQHYYTDFEDLDDNGLPSDWSSYSNGQGWYVSDDPYFEWWTAEPGVGNVIISNDDAADNNGNDEDYNDGSRDYLNFPLLDFTSFGGPVALEFGSYFTGQWNQSAYVTYSIDGGDSWDRLTNIRGGAHWQRQYIDLSGFENYESVILGFHSDDNGGWGSGWILDDIAIIDAYETTISLTGTIFNAEDGSFVPGAIVVAVEENNINSAQTMSDSSGNYSLNVLNNFNYFLYADKDGFQDQNQFVSVSDSNSYIDIFLDPNEEAVDAIVEGTLTDWYSNAPLFEASALFAYTNDDGEMETIESTTNENGYFMVQVPGEQDYDLFLYADNYWVEHDAFFLGSEENQVLSIGIPPINSAARLYGTVKDIESGDLIPYAEVQLNCDQASDWDHTGEIGTYRVFNYYPGDCDNGILVVSADGYETSIQSVDGIDFEIGSSSDLDITLMQGDDPDPGMLSGTVYSNINGNPIMGASISAYNITTSQLFDTSADSGGYFSLEIPGSDYSISINADGHQEFFATIHIEQGSSVDTVFFLDEAYSNRLFGAVYDSDGNSLEGATVTANMGGYYDYSELATVSAVDGSYELTVPNGNFDLSASLTGFTIATVTDVSIENNDQEINFTLEAVEAFDGAVIGTVYFFGNLSGETTINIWNEIYSAETVTDDNGSYHLDLINGTYSIFVTANGYNSIFMPDEIVIENNIVTHDIHFTQLGFVQPPIITSLTDVPDDQGRELDMVWSPGDPEDYGTYTQYSVWRKIDNLPPGTPELYHYISTTEFDESLSLYDKVVPTLRDVNIDSAHMSTFIVTAHTDDPYVFFDSPPVMGASVDNLSPAVPSDVSINSTEMGESSYSVDLTWSNPVDEDFAYHNIYRTDISSDDAAFVFQTIESSYTDLVTSWGNYEYWVTAVDHNGNESDPSIIESIELAVEEELFPEEFALGQNYPNPFNPSTQIRYALPEQSRVTIVIYNMLGGKVRTLVNDYQDAGYRNILWNATNDIGAPVSAGMYIYTIQAGSFYQAKKMILLK